MLDHLNRRYGGDFVSELPLSIEIRCAHEEERGSHRELGGSDCDPNCSGHHGILSAAELIDAEVMWKFDPEELGSVLDRAGFSMATVD